MKTKLSLLISLFSFTAAFCQSPGGVSQSDIWTKVIKNTPLSTFSYKDFSVNNKAITVGTGALTPSLFNYNYSYTYNASSFVSFLSKIESLKDATIFIVSLPTPTNPTDVQALMNTDWNPLVPVASGSLNEQSFKFSITNFNKNNIDLPYPTASGARPNARINTLVWHNFNSRRIVNSHGVNGESDVFVGKAFTGALNFIGDIPEFIIYRKGLNDKEKWRVESYLALKYGITLQPDVNYYNSKNEIFWHKENNQFFNNRIFGLGRDSNSTLYQRQSSSAHDTDPLKKMIFWTGTSGLLADNYTNTSYIEDQSFVTIGDNNAAESLTTILSNGIKKIDRVWMAEKFGPSTHNLVTNLKYKPAASIALLPDEALWLLIDRNAGNTAVSNFNGSGVDAYPVTSLTSGYAVYNSIKWASATSTYNQFTFGVGRKMLVTATLEPMACTDVNGNVDFSTQGGQAPFVANIHGTDNPYNLQFIQPEREFSLGLPGGSYSITITDANGFTSSTTFTVTPIPGMLLDLGVDQLVSAGTTINLNAGAGITISGVTYAWYFTPPSGTPSGTPFSSASSVAVVDPGTYTCIITNTSTGCSIQDSVTISNIVLPRLSSSKVYPNPSRGNFSVSINLNDVKDAELVIYDVTGKTLVRDYFNGLSQYSSDYKLTNTGIYFVRVTAKDYDQTHKLIIN